MMALLFEGAMHRPSSFRLLAVALSLATSTLAGAQVPTAVTRVADIRIETSGGGSYPSFGPPTELGSTVIFSGVASDYGFGRMWTTDGTAAGTRSIPIAAPFFFFQTCGVQGGRLLLFAQEPSRGMELWSTDGTAAGTTLVKDMAPGPESSFPAFAVSAGGITYFTTRDEFTGIARLWRTDGTTAGTSVVGSMAPDGELAAFGSSILFAAEGLAGKEPWISDGTAAGTRMLKDIEPLGGSSSPTSFRAFGARAAFAASSGPGWRPWVTDGTEAGTFELAPVSVGPYDASSFAADGDRSFFAADDGVTGKEPWVTDGTTAGTVRVADIRPGAGSSVTSNIAIWNGRAYFAADDGSTGAELWVSDGTPAGTASVADVAPGPMGSFPRALAATPWGVMFAADDGVAGLEPWISDGTPGGTRRLADGEPGPGGSVAGGFTLAGGLVHFQACTTNEGCEPWVTDGTPAGTRLLADLGPTQSSADPRSLLAAAGRLHFMATDGSAHGGEPWSTDGTAAGTLMTADMNPGGGWSSLTLQASSSDRVFARDDWTYDVWSLAFDAPPERLPALSRSSFDPKIAALPGGAVFAGRDAALGSEPMATDGTAGGTRVLRDVAPGSGSSEAAIPVTVGNRVMFLCHPEGAIEQVGVTDLTDAGTTFFEPPWIRADRWASFAVGDRMLFSAAESDTTGSEPWLTDGTLAGTRQLADLRPGPDSTFLRGACSFGAGFLFSADAGNGFEPWYSDGTTAGTVPLGDLFPGPGGSVPLELTDAGGFGLFVANDGLTGYELWRTDGTAAGTALVADILPGPMGSWPQDLLVVAPGVVLFVATDAARGRELWLTDGTAAGTVPWTEAWPGPEDGYPLELVLCDGRIYFSADDGSGRELFMLGDPPAAENCANAQDDDLDGDTDCGDADCAPDPACAGADTDGDGVANGSDCAPADPGSHSFPAELQDLRLSRDAAGAAVLEWPDPAPFAGTDTRADIVSSMLSNLQAWSCLGMGLPSPATDDRPGSWAYRVRASNACGPPPGEGWGTATDGTAPTAACP